MYNYILKLLDIECEPPKHMCEFPRYQMLKTHAYKYNICDLPRYRTWTIQAWPTRRPFLPPSTSMPWHSTKWLSQLPVSSSPSSSWWLSSFSSSPAWQRASGLWPQRLVCEIGRSLWIKSQNGHHWGRILMQYLSFLIDTDTLNIFMNQNTYNLKFVFSIQTRHSKLCEFCN